MANIKLIDGTVLKVTETSKKLSDTISTSLCMSIFYIEVEEMSYAQETNETHYLKKYLMIDKIIHFGDI